MKKHRHRGKIIGSGAAVIVLALAWAFRPERLAVDLAPVARGPLEVTVDEEARTRIKERHLVSAPFAGRLLRLGLKAGAAVEAGRTVVAVLEPADPGLLDPRARAQAEARIKAAAAARARMEPVLEQALTAQAYAARELDRGRDLFAHNGISRQEYDVIEEREAAARAELKSAEYQMRISDYELEVARAALLDAPGEGGGEATARRFEVRAPITGRVLRVLQESAAVVTAGTPLVELGDPTDLEVEIEVLSTDAVKISPGARVVIEHWGGEGSLAARVRVVEPAGFTKVSALGVEEQRVMVRADFTGDAGARRAVGDAFRVEARVVIWEHADVLKVPIGALFRTNGQWAVFVAEAGRAALRTIQVGWRNDREAEIVGGLAARDLVILHPGDRLQEGVRVRGR